ncbi:hypothetical protein BLNAU_23452 [Blattamonas nauphoetae]|uniref:Uncharacterized protein n=1 Tax=Blattamonas nauphoetae TaxID=2049346 RepID=A0ABQ9WQ72_9EUKA|nr:hypothetical protein BLNAU_23452 [Blattamonas nauphoetae]
MSVLFCEEDTPFRLRRVGETMSDDDTDLAVALTFGQKYTIESITNDDGLGQFIPLLFTVLDQPARITNLSAGLNGMKIEVIVETTGVELVVKAMRIKIKNADTAGQSESSTQVEFGETYQSVSNALLVDSSSFVVNTGVVDCALCSDCDTDFLETFIELQALRDLGLHNPRIQLRKGRHGCLP